jgi:hypothetical protein
MMQDLELSDVLYLEFLRVSATYNLTRLRWYWK